MVKLCFVLCHILSIAHSALHVGWMSDLRGDGTLRKIQRLVKWCWIFNSDTGDLNPDPPLPTTHCVSDHWFHPSHPSSAPHWTGLSWLFSGQGVPVFSYWWQRQALSLLSCSNSFAQSLFYVEHLLHFYLSKSYLVFEAQISPDKLLECSPLILELLVPCRKLATIASQQSTRVCLV